MPGPALAGRAGRPRSAGCPELARWAWLALSPGPAKLALGAAAPQTNTGGRDPPSLWGNNPWRVPPPSPVPLTNPRHTHPLWGDVPPRGRRPPLEDFPQGGLLPQHPATGPRGPHLGGSNHYKTKHIHSHLPLATYLSTYLSAYRPTYLPTYLPRRYVIGGANCFNAFSKVHEE